MMQLNFKAIFCSALLLSSDLAFADNNTIDISSQLQIIRNTRLLVNGANLRAADIRNKEVNPDIIRINPKLAARMAQENEEQNKREQKNIEAARDVSSRFTDQIMNVLNSIKSVDFSSAENRKNVRQYKGYIGMLEVEMSPNGQISPMTYVDREKITEIQTQLRDLKSTLQVSENTLQQDEKIAKDDEEYKSSALSLITLYAISETCGQLGYSFKSNELSEMKTEVTKQLDMVAVPSERRKEAWEAAQFGMSQANFRNLPAREISNECNKVRGNVTYAFPQVFMKPSQLPKSPF